MPGYFIELMLTINIVLIIISIILVSKSQQQFLTKLFSILLTIFIPFIGALFVITYSLLAIKSLSKPVWIHDIIIR